MEFRREAGSREPVYRQLARYYERRIAAGELLPGEPLPAERELAKRLGMNRSTVAAAYADLRSAGLVSSVRGSGTRVSETLWGDAPKRNMNWHAYVEGGAFVPTRELVRQTREMAEQPGVVNLARGELSPELMPKGVLRQLSGGLGLELPFGYADARGDKAVRERLSVHLHDRHGIAAGPDELLLTGGAQQALHLIASCLLRPGDAIGMEGPSYTYSRSLFMSAGLRLFQIAMDEQGLIPEAVADLYARHRIRMIFINPTYQNPTGTTLSAARRLELLAICQERRIPIVEDDPYSLLPALGSPLPPASLKALDPSGDAVLYVGTLSKIAAPGLRTGWIAAPAGVIRRLAEAKEEMDYGFSAVLQELTLAILDSKLWESELERIRAGLTGRRDRMLEALKLHLADAAEWKAPDGGYYLWLRLKDRIGEPDLLREAAARGVALVPGSVYGARPGCLRLAFSRESEERVGEGIARLAAVLAAARCR
ncbi:DNA-binding transcriptional regulator, MocR family, contains an aminotransferase domain [Paenibacillus sp. UNCCL117]|uniref:aminotransferase-like domain-containing protein n=1 Tax=unclassified Paenibacillus TaxID=185978 RepID=UPI00088B13D6|nr:MULTISPECIES: PLP-dependent aminotransferase family protein [unclassified Paenibacillus]SDD14685.1 DNA-binding transcriptional regulator, MocR family, contains an aminotransferase domain [Paenibacillus sp. cl123]SFW34275.1 DNA-binding transcriptional regulator, MocR family, contains an aminotransferase domain [Paenibacillus sp. UNCCL117]